MCCALMTCAVLCCCHDMCVCCQHWHASVHWYSCVASLYTIWLHWPSLVHTCTTCTCVCVGGGGIVHKKTPSEGVSVTHTHTQITHTVIITYGHVVVHVVLTQRRKRRGIPHSLPLDFQFQTYMYILYCRLLSKLPSMDKAACVLVIGHMCHWLTDNRYQQYHL